MLSLSDRQFDDMASDILMSTWKFYPDWASKEGLHEYDGGMTDVSPASIAARVRDVETRLALLHRLDPDDLSAERRFDRGVLLSALRQEKFILAELGIYRRNPMHVLHHIDVSRYVLREYAPPDERGAALTEALENVPEYVSALQSSLDSDIGTPIAAASLEAYEGMRTFYDTELATLAARMVDRSMFERFDHARRAASRALESFAARLRSLLHTSSPGFAIGSTNFRWLLEYGEMVDLPIDYLERIGEDDLRRNLIRLRKLAAEMRPDGDVAGLLRETRMNHPAASMLTAETRATVEDVRGFVDGRALVSIPSSDPCTVEAAPAFMRWAFATIDLPGVFEAGDAGARYYVTPVGDSWTDAQKGEWLSSFNYPILRVTAIHETYPGRYLQYLHSRDASSKPSVVFGSRSFMDGWAHYVEEMTIEQGFGAGDKRVQVMQLMNALLCDCRFLCAMWMHTQGMSIENAKQFFMEQAYLDAPSAEREAMRGAFDPMYLCHTLGKLQFVKLREDFKRRAGDDFSLKAFHDAALSFGAPPIPLVRAALLGEGSGDPL